MKKRHRQQNAVDPEKTLAQHLRDAVRASGFSIYRIAKDTGVDQSTLNKFIIGDRNNIRIDVADRLYRFLFHPPRRKRQPSR